METVHCKTWRDLDRDQVFEIVLRRHQVFVMEQKITDPEFDEHDRAHDTEHWWTADSQGLSSYLRVLREDKERVIGRVLTREDCRGRGLSGRIITAVLARHPETFSLHAQSHLEHWYGRFGFEVDGDVFMEAGIPHLPMRLSR